MHILPSRMNSKIKNLNVKNVMNGWKMVQFVGSGGNYISRLVGNFNDAHLRKKNEIIHYSESMLTCSSSIIGFGGSERGLFNLSH